VQWTVQGDPTLTVDTDHLRFDVIAQTDKTAEVRVSGVVTFRSAEGQVEVRNLDDLGQTRLLLENHDGWKVCDMP
jgi:hypothetical protein